MESKDIQKSERARQEEEVLAFWEAENIFEKSLQKEAPKGEFVFYDGPPFATGLPHYGHILASTIKDTIPRYRTMRGYHVRRQWGWDCHGLPLENQIEEELGLATKRDIEALGIETFNEAARAAVLRYADDWRQIIPRMGRWADMDNDYRTMDASYTESVWWIFKTLFDKGLIYEGFKSMHLCPRCGTTLSNFEVNQGYEDITDISVTVELWLRDVDIPTALLAWTTTPWTLPGNTAAAVHPDIMYVTIEKKDVETGDTVRFILAKDQLEHVFPNDEYCVIQEYPGSDLVGQSYTPPFSYFIDNTSIENHANGWKVYAAPYVTTDEGTGIVHLAPAFGEEDLELAQEKHVPIVHHVDTEGKFTDAVTDFAGMLVKEKGNHQATDIEIIKKLAHAGKLFAKEKITHSYPHCWRCDTPLLNYATSSWFVAVTKIREKLVSENADIQWVPPEVGTGRFGKWLEGARDWAISRSRYWGAPLPVWRNPDTKDVHVFGQVADIKAHVKRSGNTYLLMRHAEAESNQNGIIDSNGRNGKNPLTERGKAAARDTAHTLAARGVTKIIASPLTRTQQTAEILAKELGISADDIIYDERLQEIQLGNLDGKPISAYATLAKTYAERFEKAPDGGETLADVRRRVGEAMYAIEHEYNNETILFVAHEYVTWMATAVAAGLSKEKTIALNTPDADFIETGEVRDLNFVPLPHNAEYELDVHRPYIDTVVLEKDGVQLERVEDVFDCWFESGSMPYASMHYPFANTDTFEPKSGWFKKAKGFPADFIAEGLDQTRGWFYSLLILGVGLFDRAPYKNVIVNGTVLAEDGQKMSKKLKNYPDPMEVVHRYGADAVRFYLLSSPVVRAEDFSFAEEGVAEVARKNIGRLDNVRAFYETYNTEVDSVSYTESTNVLDVWIIARLHTLIQEVTTAMDTYELDRATRPISVFIDDLSTWYLRRSRDRFKDNDSDNQKYAVATTRYVLETLARIMAPSMPFYADYLYRQVKGENAPESVHLADWPSSAKATEGTPEEAVLEKMAEVRRLVTEALEARSQAGLKVRQPLAQLTVRSSVLSSDDAELIALIADEVNVKDVVFDTTIETDVRLDTNLTPELKAEGAAREFVRAVQDARKKAGCDPHEHISVTVAAGDAAEALATWQHMVEQKALATLTFDTQIAGDITAPLGEYGEVTFSITRNA